MKNYLKETKGITLIALAITIAVLLILASITLNVTLGENGLLTLMKKTEQNEILAEQEGQEKINAIKKEDVDNNYGIVKVDDENGPNLEVKVTAITKNSFIVKVIVTEKQSGIKSIEYSIDNGTTYVSDSNNKIATSYEFSGLTEDTEYNVKVKATDNANNIVEALVTIRTLGTVKIEQVAFVSKTTTSITISAMAIDEDSKPITYSIYVSDSLNGTYTKMTSVTGESGELVELTASGLSQYTRYYYYVEANNGKTSVASVKGDNVRTYCSGTTITCTTTYCSGGGYYYCSTCSGRGTISTSCSTCGGTGKVACPGSPAVSSTTVSNCSSCGGTNTYTYRTWLCSTCGCTGWDYWCSSCWISDNTSSHGSSQISCSSCSGSGKLSSTCSKCSGKGYTSWYYCSHDFWNSHYYCSHGTNMGVTKHYYCAHSMEGVQHD